MTKDSDVALKAKISEILNREDTVVFIGSGISIWSGLPSWKTMIKELADFVASQGLDDEIIREEIRRNDLLQAASYGVDQLTKPQFAEFIRSACRAGIATPHEIHRKIIHLGPRCFITTNFDHLLEESCNRWLPNSFFRVVSNRQLTETADIIQARATEFIFKPHGDVHDIDSVILTREQYRVLYSDKLIVLEALKTLLVSRPVVFLGFGLRDLDFTYVKDLLASIYKGGTVDHYAIMADVSELEKSYWRRHYGIHILSYPTLKQEGSGTTDHSNLLGLLDEFLPSPTREDELLKRGESTTSAQPTLSPNQILSLARYAALHSRLRSLEGTVELPLQVTLKGADDYPEELNPIFPFYGASIGKFLTGIRGKAILIGNPGAGKTYALQRTTKILAERLHDACLLESFQPGEIEIPIYIDLKFYNGKLSEMAERMFSPELSLDLLMASGNLRVFLDSFNEMPKGYFENGTYEGDFAAFIERIGMNSMIIASRTEEGLQKLQFPTFQLDEINRDFVTKQLYDRGERIDGLFETEILTLLQKPLFFRLYLEGNVDLKSATHPRQIYQSLLKKYSEEFESRFGYAIDPERILAPIAYLAIDEGKEGFLLSELQRQVRRFGSDAELPNDVTREIINHLISRNLLIPAAGSRLAFFHQSITEYLAAQELAKMYITVPEVLEKHLRYTRWDDVLFLTLGFLNEDESRSFIKHIMEADFRLLLSAAKFVETDRDSIVSKILQIVLEGEELDIEIGWALAELPVSEVHTHQLRELLKRGNSFGGAAGSLLVLIYGEGVKNELIDEIFSHPDDYNFGQDVGHALSSLTTVSDLENIVARLKNSEIEVDNEKGLGLIRGLASAFVETDFEELKRAFFPWQDLNNIQMAVLNEILEENHSSRATKLAIELVRSGVRQTIFPLFLMVSYPDVHGNIDPNWFDLDLLTALVESLHSEHHGQWALGLIKKVCDLRIDWSKEVRDSALGERGVLRLALLHCSSVTQDIFWDELHRFSLSSLSPQDMELLHLFQGMEIDWKGHESVLINLLKQRDAKLARYLLERLYVTDKSFAVSIEPVLWWLEWIAEVEHDPELGYWFCDRMGTFLAVHTSSEIHSQFLEEFNKQESSYRAVLSNYILPNMRSLSTDLLNEDTISFLLSDLSKSQVDRPSWVLLGRIATESFVEQRLLPLLSSDEENLQSNLNVVLLEAGKRHKRRYISDLP